MPVRMVAHPKTLLPRLARDDITDRCIQNLTFYG
jgi:hypothetical protein